LGCEGTAQSVTADCFRLPHLPGLVQAEDPVGDHQVPCRILELEQLHRTLEQVGGHGRGSYGRLVRGRVSQVTATRSPRDAPRTKCSATCSVDAPPAPRLWAMWRCMLVRRGRGDVVVNRVPDEVAAEGKAQALFVQDAFRLREQVAHRDAEP